MATLPSHWNAPATGFDMDEINNQIGSHVSDMNTRIESMVNNMDPNNTQDIMALSVAMNKWSVTNQLQSQTFATYKKTLEKIVSKI